MHWVFILFILYSVCLMLYGGSQWIDNVMFCITNYATNEVDDSKGDHFCYCDDRNINAFVAIILLHSLQYHSAIWTSLLLCWRINIIYVYWLESHRSPIQYQRIDHIVFIIIKRTGVTLYWTFCVDKDI